MPTRAQALLAALAAAASTYEDEELVALVVDDLAPFGPAQDIPEAMPPPYPVVPFDHGTVGALPLDEALELPEVELAELGDALTLPVSGGWARVLEIDREGIVWLSWEPLGDPSAPPAPLPTPMQVDA